MYIITIAGRSGKVFGIRRPDPGIEQGKVVHLITLAGRSGKHFGVWQIEPGTGKGKV